MAIDPNPASAAHVLALLDESSETSLAICKCGARFLEVGPGHPAEARYSHALHRYDAMMLAPLTTGGGVPIEPVRPTRETHYESGRKRRTPKAEMPALVAEAHRLVTEEGMSMRAAARHLGVAEDNLAVRLRRLRAASTEDAA